MKLEKKPSHNVIYLRYLHPCNPYTTLHHISFIDLSPPRYQLYYAVLHIRKVNLQPRKVNQLIA